MAEHCYAMFKVVEMGYCEVETSEASGVDLLLNERSGVAILIFVVLKATTATLQKVMASEHDRAVLNCIFNPLLPIGENVCDEELPADLKDDEPATPDAIQANQLELEGVKAAESGDLDLAIGIFTRAINILPTWPSCYNNRAQAYRLQDNMEGALADLDRAIALSNSRGRTGCQALCQRGIIYRREGKEEDAKRDFEAACKLGSQFAKMQLVQLNPYAALCNQMLHNVFMKLQSGEA